MEAALSRNRLVVAGCDPALSLLAQELKNIGTEVISVHCSSHQAIQWLRDGLVHVAGSHLRDRATGEYNLPQAASVFGDEQRSRGYLRRVGTGLGGADEVIRSVYARSPILPSKQIKIVNREKGSGARDLLDSALRAAGISSKSVPRLRSDRAQSSGGRRCCGEFSGGLLRSHCFGGDAAWVSISCRSLASAST